MFRVRLSIERCTSAFLVELVCLEYNYLERVEQTYPGSFRSFETKAIPRKYPKRDTSEYSSRCSLCRSLVELTSMSVAVVSCA